MNSLRSSTVPEADVGDLAESDLSGAEDVVIGFKGIGGAIGIEFINVVDSEESISGADTDGVASRVADSAGGVSGNGGGNGGNGGNGDADSVTDTDDVDPDGACTDGADISGEVPVDRGDSGDADETGNGGDNEADISAIDAAAGCAVFSPSSYPLSRGRNGSVSRSNIPVDLAGSGRITFTPPQVIKAVIKNKPAVTAGRTATHSDSPLAVSPAT